MGMLKFEVPHQLSSAEARQRLETLAEHLGKKYGFTTEWQGDSARIQGKVKGISLNAQITVAEGKVGGEATDPGFLFREKARSYLTEKFEYYLDPAYSLDELQKKA
jgi:hypothetical protein